jgi:syntaxin 6
MSRKGNAGASEDPFYAVRDTVQNYMERIKVKYERFRDVVMNTNTAINAEFKELRKGLAKDIRTIDRQIKELKGAVDMADRNRDKFKHISDSELSQRKQFVESMVKEINAIRGGMDAPDIRRKLEDDENKNKRVAEDDSLGAMTNIERDNTRFVRGQQQQTMEMIQQQDVALDSLGNAVDRLEGMGRTINTELKEQNRLLDELDQDIDDAGEKMNFVMGKLSKLLKTKDGCQIWTIVILAIILIILVGLVVFM